MSPLCQDKIYVQVYSHKRMSLESARGFVPASLPIEVSASGLGSSGEKLPHPPADIGPGSLLWQYLGDHRMTLAGMSAGILELMHPSVSAGVIDHSDFFNNPWYRIDRSVPKIIGVVYDPQGEETGKEVRGYHDKIKGVDSEGRRYHALEPETFWWTHATFHYMVEEEIDRFDTRTLTPQDREQLFRETNTWYERYGVSTRPIPPDYKSFRDKWNDICENTLEMTPAAGTVIDKVLTGKVDRRDGIHPILWNIGMKVAGSELIKVLAIGGLPEKVRDRFEIPWSWIDQVKLTTIEKTVQYWWPRDWPDNLPDYRYHPRAQAGIEYHKAQSRQTVSY